MRENNVAPADVFARIFITPPISTLSHIFPGHDALLMSDIKSGTRCHVQLEFNLMPEHESSHLPRLLLPPALLCIKSDSFSVAETIIDNYSPLRKTGKRNKNQTTVIPRAYDLTRRNIFTITFHSRNEPVTCKSCPNNRFST